MKIRMLVMDVDGTLTDGKVHISGTGELFKSFWVRDGYGIKYILPQKGIRTGIITGRSSQIVKRRAEELDINVLYQGVRDKAACLRQLCQDQGLSYEQIAYIGDDLNDLEAMRLCGVKGCPGDAEEAVKEICDFVSTKNGGAGAVREFIHWLTEPSDKSVL